MEGALRQGRIIILVVFAAIMAGCAGGGTVESAMDGEAETAATNGDGGVVTSSDVAMLPTTSAPTTTVPPTTMPPTTLSPAERVIAQMTTDEKIGQLLMPLVAGKAAATATAEEMKSNMVLGGVPTAAALVAEFHLGGVLYLGHNIENAEQVTTLSQGLQEAADLSGEVGLLISIDQEGGRVTRITDGATPVPAARSFDGDAAAVEESSLTSGTELLAQGFNVVFAPVADIADGSAGVIGDRSYSGDPAVVADMVAASIRGFKQAGIASAAKHWPGHGATIVDSHESLPTVNVDYELWTKRERVPFVSALAEGVEMVMVGHLALPELDHPDGLVEDRSPRAASISPQVIEGLLRDELGFDGIVVTDALDMGAVSALDRGELAVLSIEAGADILLAPPDLIAVRSALREALDTGRITQARLDQSVRRILRLKEQLGLMSR